jgi:CRISPR-associated protein Csm1
MSLQVFLQAQLLGAEDFLIAEASEHQGGANELFGRCAWLTLLCEVLPRALLAELKLSRMLLGSSSAEQFLLVLPEEEVPHANEFLTRARDSIAELSGRTLRLVWAITENLGAWPVVRKRLDDTLDARISAPFASATDMEAAFAPFVPSPPLRADSYFENFAQKLVAAQRVGCSTDRLGRLTWDEGQYTWPLKEQLGLDEDGILFPRCLALNDAGSELASLEDLAQRADGASKWGILRGDVDHFDLQLRRAGTIEDHLHLSMAFKDFFAGELALLCTRLPDFWRKVSILYRGGDGFTVLGAWDSLVVLARELQRLFQKFIEHNFESLPGVEAKTLSMALAIAPEANAPAATVLQEASSSLRAAKSNELGSFYLFGRTLEWKRFDDAEELKESLIRLVSRFGYPPGYIHDLASVYREAFSTRSGRRAKAVRLDKPWRTYMRVSRVIPPARGREPGNMREAVIANLVGKRMSGMKLRPSARVGLEWARLAAGN